jgi:cyanophycinase
LRQMFLYGGFGDNFEATSRPFIEAAGGESARIALLCATSATLDRYMPYYKEPWRRLGAPEIIPVYPIADTTELSAEALETLRACTAVFMCGGDTRVYHAVYTRGEAGAILRERYQAGMPYAGLSAGALVTPATASVWGDRLTTATNRLTLNGSEYDCDAELYMAPGLGFLQDVVVEAHFSQNGGFPRLVAAMGQSGAPKGLGFDDEICVEITDETAALVHGIGRAFFMRRLEGARFEATVLEPGQTFQLK